MTTSPNVEKQELAITLATLHGAEIVQRDGIRDRPVYFVVNRAFALGFHQTPGLAALKYCERVGIKVE